MRKSYHYHHIIPGKEIIRRFESRSILFCMIAEIKHKKDNQFSALLSMTHPMDSAHQQWKITYLVGEESSI